MNYLKVTILHVDGKRINVFQLWPLLFWSELHIVGIGIGFSKRSGPKVHEEIWNFPQVMNELFYNLVDVVLTLNFGGNHAAHSTSICYSLLRVVGDFSYLLQTYLIANTILWKDISKFLGYLISDGGVVSSVWFSDSWGDVGPCTCSIISLSL